MVPTVKKKNNCGYNKVHCPENAISRDRRFDLLKTHAMNTHKRKKSTIPVYSSALQLAKDGSHENLGDTVRIGVGGGTAVLKVAVALGSGLARNADRAATVGDAIAELLNGASLVRAGETLLVVLTILLDALDVVRLEVLESRLDVSHATLDTHLLGREVGVHTGTVPGALHGLGVDGNLDAKVLSDTGKEETGDPKLVTHLDALARTNLVLPLGGHDLGIGTRDLDTGD